MSEPHETPPEKSIGVDSNAAPAPAAAEGEQFVFKISIEGNERGYVGLDSKHDDWCVQVPDLASAIQFQIAQSGGTYYRAVGGKYPGSYLSYSKGGYVGLYTWYNATIWTYDDLYHHLISSAGPSLSSHAKDDPYLYAYKDYQVLTVVKVKST